LLYTLSLSCLAGDQERSYSPWSLRTEASTARRKYVPNYQNEIARQSKGFPCAKLVR